MFLYVVRLPTVIAGVVESLWRFAGSVTNYSIGATMSNTTKLLMIVCLSLLAHSVRAATTSNTLSISATVVASCTVGAASLAFGEVSQASASEVTQTGSLTVNCTTGTPYTIRLDAGQNANGDVQSRAMKTGAGGSSLNYQLYTPTNEVWGNLTATGVARSGTGADDSVTVTGKLNAHNAIPGSYTDVVTIYIDF